MVGGLNHEVLNDIHKGYTVSYTFEDAERTVAFSVFDAMMNIAGQTKSIFYYESLARRSSNSC